MKNSRNKWYYVGGSRRLRSDYGEWFGVNLDIGNGWSNYVATSNLAHAIRQFKRCRVRYRQIDLRQRGEKPRVLRWGK